MTVTLHAGHTAGRLPAYACYGTIFIVECKYTMKKENAYEKKIRFNSNNNFA